MTQNVNESIEDVFDDINLKKTEVKKTIFDTKNYLNTKLEENETSRKVQIRILPVSATNSHIAVPIKTHSIKVDQQISKSGFKKFVCLTDQHIEDENGKGCPFCNKSAELFNRANEETDNSVRKTLCKQAYSYEPKVAYLVRVIERGKEDEGVKFWRFSAYDNHNGIYDKLQNIYIQRKEEYKAAGMGYYSVFDLKNGRDFILTLTKGENSKNTEVSIMDCSIQTPLSQDENKINEWVNDPKTWRDVYSVKRYDYLKIIADGEIPVYSKEDNGYISLKEKEERDKKAEEKGKEILTGTDNTTVNTSTNNFNDDDLPF